MTPSPCTGICRLDPANVCVGCGRLLDEIVEWPSASEPRKEQIVNAAQERLRNAPARTQ
jgi:predicted Fe-S protein YdhL (DUF1289 family)